MERSQWENFIKRYPNKLGREKADAAVDELDEMTTTLEAACVVWNDKYLEIAGCMKLKGR